MSESDSGRKRRRPPKRPKTPRAMFEGLPALAADANPEIVAVGADGADHYFDEDRSRAINDRLVPTVTPHLRAVAFDGGTTSLGRLLAETKRAMASYEHQRRQAGGVDHKAVRRLLDATADALDETERALRRLNEHPAAVDFVRDLLDAFADRRLPLDGPTSMIAAFARRQRKDANWQSMAPDAVIAAATRLATALRFAAECATPNGGEARADPAAAHLVDGLAYAWRCGTGRMPTWGVDREGVRNPSPFRAYVEKVNTLLPVDWQSENDFETYALVTIRALKRRTGPALD